jgi:hypothetical protein
MLKYATLEDVVTLIDSGVQPPLIAIDGLPCSGKSTTVDRLRGHVELDCIYLDDSSFLKGIGRLRLARTICTPAVAPSSSPGRDEMPIRAVRRQLQSIDARHDSPD